MQMPLINKALIVIVCCVAVAFCSNIDDNDKSSSKFGNVVDNLETLEKANTVLEYGNAAISTGKQFKNNKKTKEITTKDNIKKVGVESGIGMAQGALIKNKKGALLAHINKIRGVINDVIEKADDRINMWRTTLPTLQAYQQNARSIFDNTVKHISTFKWSDMIDYTREWDKQNEINVRNLISVGISFYNYWDNPSDSKRTLIGSLFTKRPVYIDESDSLRMAASKYVEVQHDILLHNALDTNSTANYPSYIVPLATLIDCDNSFELVNAMLKTTTAINDGKTKDEELIAKYRSKLADSNMTLIDLRELRYSIQQDVYRVQTQQAALARISTKEYAKYLRLKAMKQEAEIEENISIAKEFKIVGIDLGKNK
jgi:hypothetical protein